MLHDILQTFTTNRGTHGSIKYGPIRVLLFNRGLRIADHNLKLYLNCLSIYLTATASRRSCFNRNGLTKVQGNHHPSVNCAISETTKRINAKFCGKVAIHHMSTQLFPFFKIWNFLILTISFSFSDTWYPMGVKISKCYSSQSYGSFSSKPLLNVPCDSPRKLHIEILNI